MVTDGFSAYFSSYDFLNGEWRGPAKKVNINIKGSKKWIITLLTACIGGKHKSFLDSRWGRRFNVGISFSL